MLLHIFPQLHSFPGSLLMGLFIVVALSFGFGLTFASVTPSQLLILPSGLSGSARRISLVGLDV